MTLRPKQQVFIFEYIKDFNATRAAKAAGYSARSAREIGSNLLTNVDIAAAIKAEIEERSMPAEEVLIRLAEQARADMGDFLDISSVSFQLDLKRAKELGLTRLIKKMKQHTTTTVHQDGTEEERSTIEIELYDAQAALTWIGKKHRLFSDRSENLNIDLNNLTDAQLVRLAAGEDILDVMASGNNVEAK